jgi:hypothetical protein
MTKLAITLHFEVLLTMDIRDKHPNSTKWIWNLELGRVNWKFPEERKVCAQVQWSSNCKKKIQSRPQTDRKEQTRKNIKPSKSSQNKLSRH